jgi:hypothetical protein
MKKGIGYLKRNAPGLMGKGLRVEPAKKKKADKCG